MPGDYEAVKKILDSNGVTNIEDIEYGGECFDELMDYFADEMPYGVKTVSYTHLTLPTIYSV